MSLKDPKEIRKKFCEIIDRLDAAKEPMNIAEQHKLSLDMSEIYNYVSAQVENKRSLTNILHTKSAHASKLKQVQEKDLQQLKKHKSFVESCFEKADQHLKAIQLGGYATFFALWGFSREWLPKHIEITTILLLTVSATFFIIWEIFKSSLLTISLRKHSIIAASSIENFVFDRAKRLEGKSSAVLYLARIRAWVWLACLIPATTSLLILLFYFSTGIIDTWPDKNKTTKPIIQTEAISMHKEN